MEEKIRLLEKELHSEAPDSLESWEKRRVEWLGKKGRLNELFEAFKALPPQDKKRLGAELNELKKRAQDTLAAWKQNLRSGEADKKFYDDLTRPVAQALGSRHPVNLVRKEIEEIFARIGFVRSEGPEIEDDWHNFSALNFPAEHPARDMQDTFFVQQNPDWALRTHTSSVQVRTMESSQPPLRTISPGRVYRNEAISARSHCFFHQIEGLYIDRGVSFADLKQTLLYFAQSFFGPDTEIRLRPSYFPFTEPSAEMDVYWGLKDEVDYRITKGTGWLEILGCGMVDPAVLESNGIDPVQYSGFAFGIGLERIALQRFRIPDIRMLFENDQRFLKLFTAAP